MARKAEGTGKIRAFLEGIALSLVDAEETLPFLKLRIQQASRRADMANLLNPALDDMERIEAAIAEAKAQAVEAQAKLMEK